MRPGPRGGCGLDGKVGASCLSRRLAPRWIRPRQRRYSGKEDEDVKEAELVNLLRRRLGRFLCNDNLWNGVGKKLKSRAAPVEIRKAVRDVRKGKEMKVVVV